MFAEPLGPSAPLLPVGPAFVQDLFFQPFLHFFFPVTIRTSPVFFFTHAVYFLAADAGCATATAEVPTMAKAARVAASLFMVVQPIVSGPGTSCGAVTEAIVTSVPVKLASSTTHAPAESSCQRG